LNLAHVLHQTSHASEIAAPLSLLVDSFGLPGEGFLTHDGSVALQNTQETLLHPLNNGYMLSAISLPVDVLAFLTRVLLFPVENGALDNVDII
ncbi:virulence effector SrfC, partial [Klebsiella pneumoniae]|nr:virulence effector SrfC [Klebsiella pneumoniae]